MVHSRIKQLEDYCSVFISYLAVEEDELHWIEEECIKLFNPLLNGIMPKYPPSVKEKEVSNKQHAYTQYFKNYEGAVGQLKEMRMSMGMTQENMARSLNVRLNTYQKAENGQNVRFKTANAIIIGFNKVREEKDLPKVDIFELGLSIV
jgi:DNA-binding XRE family transcriptional regulator